MSGFLDLSQDYLTFTNPEKDGCRYQSTRNSGTMVDSIAICKKRSASDKEQAASGGAYTGTDVLWLIPTQQLAKSIGEPKPGDVVIDRDGNEFTVLQATGKRRDANGYQQWNLMSRNLVVAYDLQGTITIYHPAVTLDAGGGRNPNFGAATPTYLKVPCRFQEITEETGDALGRRGAIRSYRVYVAKRLLVTNEDQAVDQNGAIYQIKGYENPDRIDELQYLICETIP